jgi:hypothetical protein
MTLHHAARATLVLGVLVASHVGCARAPDPPPPLEPPAAPASEPTPSRYYVAHRDTCALPACRGWFLHAVNAREPERHVVNLDLTAAKLDARAAKAVEGAPSGELVVRGTFPAADPTTFLVTEAFRGMPGRRPAPDEAFFAIDARAPGSAARLDTTLTVPIERVSVARAAAAHVDQTWLADRVALHGALVAARTAKGEGAAERGEVLDASQVFLKLPDRGGPCMLIRHACHGTATARFVRDANRCLVFRGCVEPDACGPAPKASCDEGYTIVRWAADDLACVAVACDPSFLVE